MSVSKLCFPQQSSCWPGLTSWSSFPALWSNDRGSEVQAPKMKCYNFRMLQRLMVIPAISLHFSISPCHYLELLLLKYLLPVKLRTFICIILWTKSSFSPYQLYLSLRAFFSNPKMSQTMQKQTSVVKYCYMGYTKAQKSSSTPQTALCMMLPLLFDSKYCLDLGYLIWKREEPNKQQDANNDPTFA